jgi:hypothetical protein
MYSRQLTFWWIPAAPLIPKITRRATGNNQPGFRAISSKVGLGEKMTPINLPSGEIWAGGDATGAGAGKG